MKMGLYAIGDLHLSFTAVVTGDHSWGRNLERLRMSFELAAAGGFSRFIMLLHYPPTSIGEMESGFTRMAEAYGAEQVVYSHCHGQARYQDSFLGEVNGVEYSLVSSDYLRFAPQLILD